MWIGERYELRHKRHTNRFITRPTFESARSNYAYQWRDPDGSIPWRMFRVEGRGYRRPEHEVELDPWTGDPMKSTETDTPEQGA